MNINKNMKTILTTAILFFAILNGVQSQTMEKGYYNHLTQNQNIKDKRPKPESIKFKGNKVIVVWNRREWERAQYLQRKRVEGMRKPIMNKPNK